MADIVHDNYIRQSRLSPSWYEYLEISSLMFGHCRRHSWCQQWYQVSNRNCLCQLLIGEIQAFNSCQPFWDTIVRLNATLCKSLDTVHSTSSFMQICYEASFTLESRFAKVRLIYNLVGKLLSRLLEERWLTMLAQKINYCCLNKINVVSGVHQKEKALALIYCYD